MTVDNNDIPIDGYEAATNSYSFKFKDGSVIQSFDVDERWKDGDRGFKSNPIEDGSPPCLVWTDDGLYIISNGDGKVLLICDE